MKKVRQGNYFVLRWELRRAGAPEMISGATNFSLTLYKIVYGRNPEEVSYNIVNGNTIKIDFTTTVADRCGNYYLEIKYNLAGREVKRDIAAFQIVPRTFMSDDVYDIKIVTNLEAEDSSVEIVDPPRVGAESVAIKKIRKGNVFIYDWQIIRSGNPENFVGARNLKLYQYRGRFGDNKTEIEQYRLDNESGVISIDVTPQLAGKTGVYYYEICYEIDDPQLQTGEKDCVTDITAFQIVGRTSQADELYRLEAKHVGGGLVSIVHSTSIESASDYNVFSSLKSLVEIKKAIDKAFANVDMTKYLSRVKDDTAKGFIQFLKGISVRGLATLTQGLEIGDYTTGFLGGGGAFKMINGISHLEVDKLDVRMIATFFELVISKLRHIGGQFILTPASMKCIEVEVLEGGYKCYFDRGENNEVVQEFIVNDQARCQVFSGSGLKMYWRLVTEVGDDYIVLSDTDKLEGSSIPEVGDDIVQLGYRGVDKLERTSAMVLSTVGVDAPSFKQYKGIVSYTLEGKETTALTGTGNRLAGDTIFIQDKSLDTILEEIERANKAPIIRDGYWYEWNPDSTEEDKYESTGVKAEGIKGDGVQQKFLSSDEKPEKPIGDAVGWNDIPDEEEAPDVPLEPIGDNLHSRDYLIARGWDSFPTNVEAGYSAQNPIIEQAKIEPNTQYSLEYDIYSGAPAQIRVRYSDGTYDYSESIAGGKIHVSMTTAKNKSVAAIEVTVFSLTAIFNTSVVKKLGQGAVQAKPIWTIFRNITNGVASEWSEPVKWLGEGTPGKDGKDGSDGVGLPGNDGDDGVTPHVGANGNWYIGSQDTGVPVRGPAGSGRGIISIREQFYVHTSGTIPPGTTWTWLDSMPKKTEADEGKFLWIRIKTIFTDDSTPDYSSPRVYEEWGIKDYVEKSGYLLEALREHPKVTTGLLLSKVIGMFDINDDVTAYMNGNPTLNPNAFAAGVKNFGQQGVETARAFIRHDGSSKFTDTEITGTVNATSGILDSVTVTNADIENVTISNADIKDATIDGLLKVSSGYTGNIGDYNLFWIAPMSVQILTVPTTFDSKGKTIKFYNASSTVSHTLNLLVIGYLLDSNGKVVLTDYTVSDEAKGARRDSVFIPPRGCVEVSCFEIPPGSYKSTGGGSSRFYDRVLSWEMTNRETYIAPGMLMALTLELRHMTQVGYSTNIFEHKWHISTLNEPIAKRLAGDVVRLTHNLGHTDYTAHATINAGSGAVDKIVSYSNYFDMYLTGSWSYSGHRLQITIFGRNKA